MTTMDTSKELESWKYAEKLCGGGSPVGLGILPISESTNHVTAEIADGVLIVNSFPAVCLS